MSLANAIPRTKVKGAWVVREAGLIDTLCTLYFDDVELTAADGGDGGNGGASSAGGQGGLPGLGGPGLGGVGLHAGCGGGVGGYGGKGGNGAGGHGGHSVCFAFVTGTSPHLGAYKHAWGTPGKYGLAGDPGSIPGLGQFGLANTDIALDP